MLVGRRIKDLRMAKGLSQQELGEILGVTKVSICGYENGTRIPSLEIFLLLASVFNVSTDYLLGREIAVNEDNRYVGSVSSDDVSIITELKHYPVLYDRMLKDSKRFIQLINKKMG